MAQNGYPKPFLRWVQLLPEESLTSFLKRLEMANFITPSSLLLQFFNEQFAKWGIRDNLKHPRQPQTYELLSSLTGAPAHQLVQATPHRFARLLNSTHNKAVIGFSDGAQVELAHKENQNTFCSDESVQYCPLCLREAAYHRLEWQPRLVSVCLKHGSFLLARCIRCDSRIDLATAVSGVCPKCHACLAGFNPPQVREQSLGMFGQCLIQAWLGMNQPPSGNPWQFPEQPAEVLFQFVQHQFLFLLRFTNWDYFYWSDELPPEADPLRCWSVEYMKPACSYVLCTTAFKGLVDWPYGFLEFLDEYQTYARHTSRSMSRVSTEELLSRWSDFGGDLTEWEFVREACRRFVCDTQGRLTRVRPLLQNQEMVARFAYLTVQNAASYLNSSEESVYRLVEAGKVTAAHPDRPVRKISWVKRSDVEAVHAQVRSGATSDEVAILLGMPESVVLELAEMSLLDTVRILHPVSGGEIVLFHRRAVWDLKEHCLETAKVMVYEVFLDRVELLPAAQLLAGLGVSPAVLIREILNGSLPVYLNSRDEQRLDELVFLCRDLQALALRLIYKEGWLTQEETAQRLGVNPVTAQRWIASGLLKPVKCFAEVVYFDKGQVSDFYNKYFRREEAARFAKVSADAFDSWVRRSVLRPVSGRNVDGCQRLLFRRSDLESLMLEMPLKTRRGYRQKL